MQVIDDAILGRLVYDPVAEWYEGRAEVTPGRTALVFVCSDPDAADGVTAAGVARETVSRLRQEDARLRRIAAERLAARYPERVSSLTVEQVATVLWAGAVYTWDDGGARVDWDAVPPLLNWSGSNWVSHVDPTTRCVSVGWEHERRADANGGGPSGGE